MAFDLDSMSNREMEDVEEYVGRPIMGFLNRAFQAATKERQVEGKDPNTGEPFTETEEYIDENELMDRLPTKIFNALTCIERRRKDPEFTMDKWGDARFGDEGNEDEPEGEQQSEDPTEASSLATVVTLSEVPASSSESVESENDTSDSASVHTLPSSTSTQDHSPSTA